MKKTSLQSLAVICLLIIFTSCHKRVEFEVPCKILKIAHVDRTGNDPGQNYSGYFTYTPWGDPSTIKWDTKTTGRPDYFFTYDNKHRLTRFEGLYTNMVFDFVTKYIYEGDKIVGDSSWFIGSDVNNFRGTAFASSVSKYTYDAKGRITRVDSQTNFGSITGTFEYDAAGNRVRPDATYDNKKNFLRTNAWLMLVTKDFSMNNPRMADTYNKKGLPLSLGNADLSFLNSFINEIDYSCDNKID